jgi:hypothetical protein
MTTDATEEPKADLTLPLDRWTFDHAKRVAEADPEAMAGTVMALLAQETSALPGTAFVKRQDGSILKKHVVGVRLTEREGHLVSMPKGKWDYALLGLRKMNEVVGLLVMRPDQVMVEGKPQMNPYIQVNEDTRMPEVVYARCFAIGYSSFGSLVATDAMVRLDLNIYLLENLQSKMKKLGEHGARLAEYGGQREHPVDDEGKKRPGKWRWMPLHSVGGIGLWVNLAAPEFGETIQDHTTRLKFIERLAQSFAERNATKAHPAIPKTVNAGREGTATIRVGGWTTDFDRREIDRLRDLAQRDQLHEFEEITVEAVEVTVHDQADRASMEDELASQRGAERKEEEDDDREEQDEDLLPDASEQYKALVDLKGKAGARKILGAAGIEHLEEASPEQLAAFIAAAKEAQ